MDAANILKPALARGGIRVIGTTTNMRCRQSQAFLSYPSGFSVAEQNLANAWASRAKDRDCRCA